MKDYSEWMNSQPKQLSKEDRKQLIRKAMNKICDRNDEGLRRLGII